MGYVARQATWASNIFRKSREQCPPWAVFVEVSFFGMHHPPAFSSAVAFICHEPAVKPTAALLPKRRFEAIVRYILDNTLGTEVLIFALSPRNTPSCGCYLQPSVFTSAIAAVNKKLR